MKKITTLLFLTTLSFTSVVYAQEWSSHQSPVRINDLVDNGSELVMATDYGLVVMNKNTLEKNTFTKYNSQLPDNAIKAITKAANGDIYLITNLAACKFDGTNITEIVIPSEFKKSSLRLFDIEIASNGEIWIGCSEGIFHRTSQFWYNYSNSVNSKSSVVWDIEIDNNGFVFAGSNNGVHKYDNGLWSHITKDDSLEGYASAELFISKSGDLYFGGDLTKTAKYDGTKWQIYNHNSATPHMQFTEDENNNIYLSTNGQVWQLNNNAWIKYNDPHTLSIKDILANGISYYYIDDQNHRWFFKNIYLSRSINGSIQSTKISSNTIETNTITEIHKGKNGKLFFIMGNTSTKSIAVIDPQGNWSSLKLPDSLNSNSSINDILFLAEDDIYVTSIEGLSHYDGKKWSTNNLLKNGKKLAVNSQGKVYLLASKIIYIIENGNVSEFTTNNSPISNLDATSGLGIDANDNLWIASFDWSGNSKIQKVTADGKWTTYDHTNHPSIDQPKGNFHFDKNGNVWISTKIGAIKYDGQNFTNPIKENISNLENYNCTSIESDSEGRIYFAHQYGVTTLFNQAWGELLIEEVPNKKTSATSIIKFDNDGTLWWGSNIYGLYSYKKSATSSIFSNNELTPNIYIYPNPSTGFLNFKNIDGATLNVFNTLGELVYSNDKINQDSSIQLNQTPGIYFVVLKKSNSTYTQKLIIQ